MRKKYLPVGVDDFKKIIEDSYYFVDKSMFISELLNSRSEITLIPRPRRFGKSLNMSMLKYFFNIENAKENRKLFKGLKIEKTEFMEQQGKYPVIHISFKDFKMGSWELCLEKIKESIVKIYREKDFLIESLKSYEKDEFNQILMGEISRGKLENSLEDLSEKLHRHYGKKVIILIDEYDTPLTSAYTEGYYEEAISFFRNFLSAAYKSNVNLEFGVMTGITRVTKESIFSGLNNLKVASILDDNYQYFGLTELEVEELLKYYELDYELKQIKWWYNGYNFGGTQMYNPWSIINFTANNNLKSYWINSSDNILIKNILKKNDGKIQKDLENLFKGQSIEETLKENLVFDELEKIDTVWSLLFFTGYLTYSRKKISSITGATTYDLVIPNQEVRTFFKDVFVAEYSDNQSGFYLKMIEELYLGKIEEFSKKFKEIYMAVISYYDKADSEKYYHHFMLGLLLTLSEKYSINSNRESGNGRYDIAMFPKEKNHHGIIFEFKIADSKEKLKEKSLEALWQIKTKEYATTMKHEGVKEIIKIGIAFYGKNLEISWER